MGNSQASGRGNAAEARDEPLEAYLREKQRNDHLKNLGFKRQTSFRKSIAKKLKRHSKHKQPPSQQNNSDGNGSTTLEVVDSGPNNQCDVHEVPFRRPSYTSSNHTRSSSNPNLAAASSSKVVWNPLISILFSFPSMHFSCTIDCLRRVALSFTYIHVLLLSESLISLFPVALT